jgi:hypothetical protein
LPIEINDVSYFDGGLASNNPTKEAIDEAHLIWPDRPIGIIVSVGTGIEEALHLKDKSTEAPLIARKMLNKSAGFKLAVAEYVVKCATNCHLIHEEVKDQGERLVLGSNYFRFNVPYGLSSIGLEEWRKLSDIIGFT